MLYLQNPEQEMEIQELTPSQRPAIWDSSWTIEPEFDEVTIIEETHLAPSCLSETGGKREDWR